MHDQHLGGNVRAEQLSHHHHHQQQQQDQSQSIGRVPGQHRQVSPPTGPTTSRGAHGLDTSTLQRHGDASAASQGTAAVLPLPRVLDVNAVLANLPLRNRSQHASLEHGSPLLAKPGRSAQKSAAADGSHEHRQGDEQNGADLLAAWLSEHSDSDSATSTYWQSTSAYAQLMDQIQVTRAALDHVAACAERNALELEALSEEATASAAQAEAEAQRLAEPVVEDTSQGEINTQGLHAAQQGVVCANLRADHSALRRDAKAHEVQAALEQVGCPYCQSIACPSPC
jgi:hypothetical protein